MITQLSNRCFLILLHVFYFFTLTKYRAKNLDFVMRKKSKILWSLWPISENKDGD